MSDKLKELEKRIERLEKLSGAPAKKKSKTSEQDLVKDLDNLMKKHEGLFAKGILFSGLAMPSTNPKRLIRWSGCGGFKSANEVDQFIDQANSENISRFSSNFSSPEKLNIIKCLLKSGPLGQKAILDETGLTQGQFYHHIKDLIGNKMVEKEKQDEYDLSSTGHVLAMSFMGIIHAFMK